jgi:glycosyltransferase involved in cell wall biosynthesis
MRALWITTQAPDRSLGGGSIRDAHMIEALGSACETELLLCGQLEDPRTRRVLARVMEVEPPKAPAPLPQWRRRLRDIRWATIEAEPISMVEERPKLQSLRAMLPDLSAYDIVCIQQLGLTPVVPARRNGRWSLSLYHLAGRQAEQSLALARTPRHRWLIRRELAKARRAEAQAATAFDAVITVSAEDAAALGRPSVVIPNGVDLARFVPRPLPARPRLVVTGSLNYLPNVDGTAWFVHEVLPRIRLAVPDVTLEIVGRRPVGHVISLGDQPGVTIRPDVPDIVEFLDAARVAVVPIRIGSGTRLKALEAMAAGRPVVGTRLGLEGLGIVTGRDAYVADSPEAMAAGVIALLGDDALANRVAAAARDLVVERFGWESLGRDFVRVVLGR